MEANSTGRMRVAFVIPAYNEEAMIGQCLEAILAEIDRSGHPADIIVIDNASTDRTGEIAASYPGVRVVKEMNKGLVHARHAGFVASAGYDLVANIDADTMVPEGWLSTVFDEFTRHPELVCLSGPYFYYDLTRGQRALVEVFYVFTYVAYVINRFVLRVGSVIHGGNFVFRREAWEKAGGFDRSIAFYGEDTDVAVRMSKIGPVKWTHRLRIKTSGRRLAHEGILRTGFIYAKNFVSMTFRGKPATTDYQDIRE